VHRLLQELARKEALQAQMEEEKKLAAERAKSLAARKKKPRELQDREEEADKVEAERVAMMHEPSLRRTKHVPPTNRLSATFFRVTANRAEVFGGLPANVTLCADVTTQARRLCTALHCAARHWRVLNVCCFWCCRGRFPRSLVATASCAMRLQLLFTSRMSFDWIALVGLWTLPSSCPSGRVKRSVVVCRGPVVVATPQCVTMQLLRCRAGCC
jgi:hypothetical protein